MLEVVRLIASRAGFDDVDAEPLDTGWKITARKKGFSVTEKGPNQEVAATKLVGFLWSKFLAEPTG